jgi:hypothetical protein
MLYHYSVPKSLIQATSRNLLITERPFKTSGPVDKFEHDPIFRKLLRHTTPLFGESIEKVHVLVHSWIDCHSLSLGSQFQVCVQGDGISLKLDDSRWTVADMHHCRFAGGPECLHEGLAVIFRHDGSGIILAVSVEAGFSASFDEEQEVRRNEISESRTEKCQVVMCADAVGNAMGQATRTRLYVVGAL